VARELAPAGLRSGPTSVIATGQANQGLGVLRPPAGASSLATKLAATINTCLTFIHTPTSLATKPTRFSPLRPY